MRSVKTGLGTGVQRAIRSLKGATEARAEKAPQLEEEVESRPFSEVETSTAAPSIPSNEATPAPSSIPPIEVSPASSSILSNDATPASSSILSNDATPASSSILSNDATPASSSIPSVEDSPVQSEAEFLVSESAQADLLASLQMAEVEPSRSDVPHSRKKESGPSYFHSGSKITAEVGSAENPVRTSSPRKMTLRGRLTIAAGLGIVAVPVLWMLASLLPELPSTPVATQELPPVSAISQPLPPAPIMPPVARGALVEGSLTSERGDVYTLDPDFTQRVWGVLDKGRVELGHVLVMDPRTGELLAYVSTDPNRFPPDRAYPAASLVKVVTAAALMDASPAAAEKPCRYAGNPYRLNRRGVDPPKRGGNEMSLRRALSTSNNKCFAQYAVHQIGSDRLMAAIDRFGLLRSAGPAHPAGEVVDPGKDKLELGQLGSGLDGLRITPLHAIQLAGILAHGRRVQPTWIAGLAPTPPAVGEQVLTESLTRDLRDMLKDTTKRGTARKAFRTRRGHPLLKGVEVAGKTGSLNGNDPKGRYEWFIGVAPADKPTLAIATVAVQGPLYWMSASQLAAEVLKVSFCPKGVCSSEPPQARRTVTAHQPVGG